MENFGLMLENRRDAATEMGGRSHLKSGVLRSVLLPPSCWNRLLIVPSRSGCLLRPPRCATLIPQLPLPLMFTVTACTPSFPAFSPPSLVPVSVIRARVGGRRAAAGSPPLPSSCGSSDVSSRSTHSSHQERCLCLFLHTHADLLEKISKTPVR